MTLRELLGDGPDVVVTGLTFDNRLVVPGTLFFCVPGFTRDGHDFAPDAVKRGAAALVVQRPLDLGVPEILDAGDPACAMEISSHALELRRADGIHVTAAVFTNLTQDHLDFHPTMEDYFQAKRLLFSAELTQARIANADDAYG